MMRQPATGCASEQEAERRQRLFESIFITLLFAIAFVVRLWGLSRMHYWDENVYLQNAELICCGKTNFNEIDSRPPLISILFAGAFKLWNSDYAAWVVTSALNALGPLFLYLGGRLMTRRSAAIIAVLLFAFVPFFAGVLPDGSTGFVSDATGHSLLTDCPAATLLALSLWLILRALKRQTSLSFVAAGFACALAILMRFGSLSSVGVLSLLILTANRKFRAVLGSAIGFLLGMGPYLCWSRYKYGGFLDTFRAGWVNFAGPAESPFFFVKLSPIIFSWITLAGLALWIAQWCWQVSQDESSLHLSNAASFSGRFPRWREGFLWIWTLVALAFFSSLSHKEPRYVMPVAPPLFLLSGIGLSVLLRGKTQTLRTAGATVLAVALCFTFWPDHHRFDTGFLDDSVSEEMEVSDFLNHNLAPSTVLYTNMNYPDFGWYTKMPVVTLPDSGPPLYDTLKELPDDGILIAYTKDDDNKAMEPSLSWVDANPHFRRLKEFPTIILYRYLVNPEK